MTSSYLVVVGEVGLQANDSLLSEVLGEHVSGTPTSTFRVGHFVRFSIYEKFDIS